ncbi:MAG: glucose-6-phosphate 1-epimerase [Paraglaciecola sp.]|jgi:glucose-6-phosphate 1-epimerase
MLLSDSTSITTQEKIQILVIDNDYAFTTVSLFGGQILSFTPKYDQRARLWLSNNAILDGKKPIRGGIPVCWPWFGDHQAVRDNLPDANFPAHGYVRTQQWKIVKCHDTSKATEVVLQPNYSQGDGFDGKAQLSLIINVGVRLSVKLVTENLAEEAFSFTCALHSYFAIADVHTCKLSGFSGDYIDKTRNWKTIATPSPYAFSEETDRVHLSTPQKISIVEDAGNIDIMSAGHDSMVVWNPWAEKSAAMIDVQDDGFQTMLCVETAITQGQTVEPGGSHTLEQIIK